MLRLKFARFLAASVFVLPLFAGCRPAAPPRSDEFCAGAPAATGVKRPEDLVRLPGTKWVVASSMPGPDGEPGALYAIDSSSASAPVKLYPAESSANEPDRARFRDCPGPPNAERFFPHGLNVRPLDGADFELLVVNHGEREAIEVFRITATDPAPRARWVGCVLLPGHAFGNGIAPLSDGGFVVTKMYDTDDPAFMSKFATGQPTGGVLRWKPQSGWSDAITQPLSGANGVEVSPDGDWLYVSEWSARKFWAFALNGQTAPKSIDVDFLPDNLRWTERGTLLLAGQNAPPEKVFGCEARHEACPLGFTVAEIDPSTMRSRVLFTGGDATFGGATGALFVGRDLWVGSFRGGAVGRLVPIADNDTR